MTQLVVLHVCAVEYSARTLLVPQLDFLAANGYQPRLACAPDDDRFKPGLERFDPLAVEFSRSPTPLAVFRSARRLRAVLDEVRPDILHLHSSSAALPARLLSRKVLRRQPVVFTVHGFPFQWGRRKLSANGARIALEWLLSKRTDTLLFQSQEDLDGSKKARFGGRLIYLGNGVQDHWFDVHPHVRGNRLRVLFTGRLIRAKGILDLLQAAAAVPQVELVVAGGRISSERDDISEELDRLLADPALDGRVTMMGHVDPVDMPALMETVDVFALPTFHDEGVPRSMIEAMAAGRPVIGTNVRGCRELIQDGTNGWLIQPHDVDGLRAALTDACNRPAHDLAELGADARQFADERHRESLVLARLVASYDVRAGVPA